MFNSSPFLQYIDGVEHILPNLIFFLFRRLVVGSPLPCSLLVTCTLTNIDLQLEPSNGVDGLLSFLHEDLKDDLEEGKIGRIWGIVKCYFTDSSSKNSYDDESGSAPSSIRSQAFSLSSYYQSMYEVLNKIGKCGYGRVFECRHKLDGITYAVNKIPFNEDQVIHRRLRKVMNYLVQMTTHMAQILLIH
ncbi:uncharacterized protein [Primulina huaijiensis]|uniref:uncharacterized protein n=1 Tax=Primulina huaijiensis TaxID=1492673 RepID=UPI003CC6F7E3